MSIEQNLVICESSLPPASDWVSRHEGWILLRIASGVGYWLKAGGPAAEFEPGEVMAAHSSCTPTLRASALGPVQIQFVLVLPELLSGVLSLDEMRTFNPAAASRPLEPAFFAPDHLVAQKFARLAGSPDPHSATARLEQVRLWMDATAGLNLPGSRPVVNEPPLRSRFRQLVRRMSAGELSARSAGELAGGLGCSTRHFHRLFLEEFGESLRSFQTNLRLARARKFLTESNTKIINVAQESGYNHLGLFNSMFKRRFGMTPGDWRRQSRKQPVRDARRQLATR